MSCPHTHPPSAAAAGAAAAAEPPVERPTFWRSLDELSDTPAFREHLHREFPAAASEWHDGPSRRNFLKLMGASLALAGVTGVGGCTKRDEKIIPYVVPPEQLVPGRPLFYATAMPFGGYGVGLLAEQHMGRPTKVEGNPDHPASLGATDAFTQASVLSLYDPDRAQTITRTGQISTWSAFVDMVAAEMARFGTSGGGGLRILTETVTSPTLLRQLNALLERYPQARWHHWEPVGRGSVRAGATMAFGRPINTVYRFDRAERILSLDSDFLLLDPGAIRYNHDFAESRRVRLPGEPEAVHHPAEGQINDPHGSEPPAGGVAPHNSGSATQFAKPAGGASAPPPIPAKTRMSRLYAVESTPTITGAMADHRLSMPASAVEQFARDVLQAVRNQGGDAAAQPGTPAYFIRVMVADLLAHRGRSLVVAGAHQAPAVHAIAHALNDALDAVGQTVVHTEPVEAHPDGSLESLRALVADMNAGLVDTLIIIGSNPVYTAPADLGLSLVGDDLPSNPLSKVRLRIQQSLYYDETSYLCHWHIPEAHYLEMWGDVRAFDGTASVIQPLIHPLYDAISPYELLAALLGRTDTKPLELVRETWRAAAGSGDFEAFWRAALEKGVIPNSAAAPVEVSLTGDVLAQPPTMLAAPATNPANAPDVGAPGAGGFEILFRPDPTIYDGRFANNGWLQELPKPLTKLTWDNVAYISPATARQFGLERDSLNGWTQLLGLTVNGRYVEYPAWVVPGHPDGAITLFLGGGRRNAGRVGTGVGFNGYQVRTSDAMWIARGVQVRNTGTAYRLACTQPHQMLEGRANFRVSSIAALAGGEAGPIDVPAGAPVAPGHGEQTVEPRIADPDYAAPVRDTAAQHEPGPVVSHSEGHHRTIHLSLYPEYKYEGHAWGMVIDQNVCTGCSACVVACNAENNIPIVGKAEVIKGREMHWLRIDTYYKGEAAAPDGPYFQPMLCQHCENAPCEVVCPVVATSHSAEGINEMTYNRCIGTRYCSNNCPYKVRRFNFFQYADWKTPVAQLRHNPDVTVRTRGVMEKCTYCIQRINETRRELKQLNGNVENGAFVGDDPKAEADRLMLGLKTACQDACPTHAIVFGDLNWVFADGVPMEVTQLKAQAESYHYGVLTELNTQPRTTYLARATNPHPDLEPAQRLLDSGPRQPHEAARG